jgi:hypothetical protein
MFVEGTVERGRGIIWMRDFDGICVVSGGWRDGVMGLGGWNRRSRIGELNLVFHLMYRHLFVLPLTIF